MRYLLLSIFFLINGIVLSQGTIRGTLIDSETQEPLIGGIIRVDNSTSGAVTDIDGSYSIQLPAGTYSINHTYVGYQPVQITDIVVVDGEVNFLGNIALSTGNEIDAVVITVVDLKNTEEGLLNFQRNSTKILDAVSAESIAKTGDSDVAAVVKRVPGVTIEGGKYVYVRGLGDRYTKSTLNGLEIPGLDPERNTVQMDIFPANIVDNIVVYKTYSPDLPGDFSGGMVNVETKDFPDEKFFDIGVSFGYNSETTFNDDYILYDGQGGDIFGFGKSGRELPFSRSFEVNQSTDAEISENTLALNNEVAATSQDSFFTPAVTISYGNQTDLKNDNQLGYNFSLNYRQDQTLKNDFQQTLLQVRRLPQLRLDSLSNIQGRIGSHRSLLSAVGGVALKNTDNKYSLKFLHTRTGENEATLRNDDNFINDQFNFESVLDYFQRTITNGIISGEHFLDNDAVLKWGNAFTHTTVDNPDRTNTSVVFGQNNTFRFTGTGDSGLSKEWRDLSEISNNFQASYEMPMPFDIFDQENSLFKFGMSSFYKQRDYDAYSATLRIRAFNDMDNQQLATISDLDELLARENIFTPTQSGYGIGNFLNEAPNTYDADMHVLGGFFMGDIAVTDRLKFIGGLRVENVIMNYDGTSRETFESINEETLNSTQFLPSANFVYELRDYMNLRASYNRTLARPSFREKSEAIIFDPVSATTFYGDLSLVETEISNYDLRWEYFFESDEMISVSGFYKHMKNPIEYQALDPAAGPDDITAVNKEEADVIGAELELRKNLGFIGTAFDNFSFNGNVSVVESIIELSDVELSKFTTAQVEAPDDRQLLGQSPYSVNAGFGYKKESFSANANYNVKGRTLAIIGLGQYPNVYEIPVHRVSARVNKQFGGNLQHNISLTGNNLLNQKVRFNYEFPGLADEEFNSFSPGIDLSIGYTYSFH